MINKVQAVDKYMIQYRMQQTLKITSQQRIFILIAAYAHDSGHQGLTNNFYINSGDSLAIKFSNMSPLQNMHSSNLMSSIRLHGVEVPQQKKQLMVKLILATDNKHHFQLLAKIKKYQQLINQKIIGNLNQNDQGIDPDPCVQFRQPLLEMLIHTADINSCGKPLQQYLKWNQMLYDQFRVQFIKQTELDLKHSFKFDLDNWQHSVAVSNLGFFDLLILPFFKEVAIIIPDFKVQPLNALKIRDYFQGKAKGNKNKTMQVKAQSK